LPIIQAADREGRHGLRRLQASRRNWSMAWMADASARHTALGRARLRSWLFASPIFGEKSAGTYIVRAVPCRVSPGCDVLGPPASHLVRTVSGLVPTCVNIQSNVRISC